MEEATSALRSFVRRSIEDIEDVANKNVVTEDCVRKSLGYAEDESIR
jgi:hypothetical protein